MAVNFFRLRGQARTFEPGPDDLSLLEEPFLSSLLPARFANGNEFETMQMMCAGCNDPFDPDRIHARLKWLGPSVLFLECAIVCHTCRRRCFDFMRIYDDARVLRWTDAGRWSWHEGFRVPAWFGRLASRAFFKPKRRTNEGNTGK